MNLMNKTRPSLYKVMLWRVVVAFFMTLPCVVVAASTETNFLPLTISFQHQANETLPIVSEAPAWFSGAPSIQPQSDRVDLPVPPLASQDEIGCFALTVVFQDNGDGGPVVEWLPRAPHAEAVLLSSGLGETGVDLGLNARTILLPQQLALDGGSVRVSFPGRFARLLSLSLRPARELGVAALGPDPAAAVIEQGGQTLSASEVSGADEKPARGDTSENGVVHAELSATPIRLDLPGSDAALDVLVPLSAIPRGSFLHAEVGGLDPESWIEVSINGEPLGAMGGSPFALNDPRLIISSSDRLLYAGWRHFSLFIPSRVWKEGENAVTFTLRRANGDGEHPVYIRKALVDLLFPSPSPDAKAPTAPSNDPAETLSTGSVYGNPSPTLFHASPPAPLSALSAPGNTDAPLAPPSGT